MILTPVGMNSSGQFCIGASGDALSIGTQSFVTCIYAATTDATVTNTVTETSAIGTGNGTKTLAANSISSGRVLRIDGGGVYSAAAVTPGNLTIRVKLGSTIIASVVLGALVSGASTLAYNFESILVFRTIGATGTVLCHGMIDYNSGVGRNFGDLTNGGVVTTIDTSVSQVIDVTAQWQTASTSNILKNTFSNIEILA